MVTDLTTYTDTPLRALTEEEIRAEETRSWSYADLSRAQTLWGPHGYHRYPAKFIPQLARRIIDEYSEPGMLVADPFAGSGTAGVEALRSGRRAWLGDINPVAVLISRAKTQAIEPDALAASWRGLEQQVRALPRVTRRTLTHDERAVIELTDIAHATPEERWRYWFPEPHRASLARILDLIVQVPHGAMRTLYLCGFSDILRPCSIWLSGSTKAQRDLTRALADPVEAFLAQGRNMVTRNALYWNDLKQAGHSPEQTAQRSETSLSDARDLPLADQSVDLLVTSPPYATCYEYAEIHQLSHLWFSRYQLLPEGLVPTTPAHHGIIGTKGAAVAARLQAERARHATTECAALLTGSPTADAALDALTARAAGAPKSSAVLREVRGLQLYFLDMARCLHEFSRVVAPNRYMALVIGDSRKRGITIPTSAALCELAVGMGFCLERRIVRQIPVRILTRTRDAVTGRFSSTADSDSQAYPEEDILIFKRAEGVYAG